jgi:hypothetical protein
VDKVFGSRRNSKKMSHASYALCWVAFLNQDLLIEITQLIQAIGNYLGNSLLNSRCNLIMEFSRNFHNMVMVVGIAKFHVLKYPIIYPYWVIVS